MDNTAEQTNEQLYEQALAHYRAARWTEAIACLGELLERGQSTPEMDALLQDIKFKQRLDAAQAPLFAPAPAPRPSPAGLALRIGTALTGLGIIVAGIWLAIGRPTVSADGTPPSIVAAVSALPTPAPVPPTPAPTTAPVGAGTLLVTAPEGEALAIGARNVYLILDASGSMLARVDERRKIDLAQEALVGLVERLPAASNVALRTYGRRRPDDCTDVELVAPMGPLDRDALRAQIEGVEPVNLSRTPIGNSLAAIPIDLAAVSGETKVVLVSDGEESCGADPVAIAARLREAEAGVSVSVVGFDIAPELRAVLAQIAEAGGGSYYDAGNVEQLAAALEDVVAPRFRVLGPDGVEVGSGTFGTALELPAGSYTVAVSSETAQIELTAEVRDGMATIVTISPDGDQIGSEVRLDWQP